MVKQFLHLVVLLSYTATKYNGSMPSNRSNKKNLHRNNVGLASYGHLEICTRNEDCPYTNLLVSTVMTSLLRIPVLSMIKCSGYVILLCSVMYFMSMATQQFKYNHKKTCTIRMCTLKLYVQLQ